MNRDHMLGYVQPVPGLGEKIEAGQIARDLDRVFPEVNDHLLSGEVSSHFPVVPFYIPLLKE